MSNFNLNTNTDTYLITFQAPSGGEQLICTTNNIMLAEALANTPDCSPGTYRVRHNSASQEVLREYTKSN